MNPVNSVVLSRRDFKSDEELYTKVAQQMRLLLEAGYVLVAEDVDEKGGTIVIQYSPASTEVQSPKPFWLMPDEYVAAADVHMNIEIDKANKVLEASRKADDFISKFTGGGNNSNNGFDA